MDERRSDQRTQVSWPVRVWLGDGVFAIARAVDVSLSGMRLTVSPSARAMIHVDESYTLEVGAVSCPLARIAEVKHRHAGVGVEFKERLPQLPDADSPAEKQVTSG